MSLYSFSINSIFESGQYAAMGRRKLQPLAGAPNIAEKEASPCLEPDPRTIWRSQSNSKMVALVARRPDWVYCMVSAVVEDNTDFANGDGPSRADAAYRAEVTSCTSCPNSTERASTVPTSSPFHYGARNIHTQRQRKSPSLSP